MNQNVNIIIAFSAGIISFISPCILPVIPSYLSFIGGVSYSELVDKKTSKWGIFLKSLIFVAGFSLVFTVLGVISAVSVLHSAELQGSSTWWPGPL